MNKIDKSADVAINIGLLQEVVDKLTEGFYPKVDYNDDKNKMLNDAYKIRGDMIGYAINRLKTLGKLYES